MFDVAKFADEADMIINGYAFRRPAGAKVGGITVVNLNDLSMLTAVGHGIAMGNSSPAVRDAVMHHCLTNDEDGAARYLDQYRSMHFRQEVH